MSSLHCLQNVFFSRDEETLIIAEGMHVVQVLSSGGFGGWWIGAPKKKVAFLVVRIFVKIQMASQDWCLEDGSLKFSCRKKHFQGVMLFQGVHLMS